MPFDKITDGWTPEDRLAGRAGLLVFGQGEKEKNGQSPVCKRKVWTRTEVIFLQGIALLAFLMSTLRCHNVQF